MDRLPEWLGIVIVAAAWILVLIRLRSIMQQRHVSSSMRFASAVVFTVVALYLTTGLVRVMVWVGVALEILSLAQQARYTSTGE